MSAPAKGGHCTPLPSRTPLPSSQPLRLHPIALPNSMGAESPSAALPSLGPAAWTLTHCHPCGLGTHRVPRCVSSSDVGVQRHARGAARLHPGEREGLGGLCLDLERGVQSPLAWRRRKGVFLLRISVSFLAEVFSCLPPAPSPPFSSALLGRGT